MQNKGTVFISGKITSLPHDEYMQMFTMAEIGLTMKGYRVINPARVGDVLPENMPYKCYMDLALSLLKYCDYIYFLPNAKDSKGSKIERAHARRYGVKVLTDDKL